MSRGFPYQCYRCGHSTKNKTGMNYHLFLRQKACPPTLHNIDLTDEIRTVILRDRIYCPPSTPLSIVASSPASPATPAQIHNNYHLNQLIQINYHHSAHIALANNIKRIDPLIKLNRFLEYKNEELKGVDDGIEEYFEDTVTELDDLDYITNNITRRQPYTLSPDDLLDALHQYSRIDKDRLSHMNIIMNKKDDRLYLYNEGRWQECLTNIGLMTLIKSLVVYYLSSYEMYLIRGLERRGDRPITDHPQFSECLTHYYQFIGTFKVDPYVKTCCDAYVLERDVYPREKTYELSEKYMTVFGKTMARMDVTEKKIIKDQVVQILAVNTRLNFEELNRSIMEIIHADPHFLEHTILEQKQ